MRYLTFLLVLVIVMGGCMEERQEVTTTTSFTTTLSTIVTSTTSISTNSDTGYTIPTSLETTAEPSAPTTSGFGKIKPESSSIDYIGNTLTFKALNGRSQKIKSFKILKSEGSCTSLTVSKSDLEPGEYVQITGNDCEFREEGEPFYLDLSFVYVVTISGHDIEHRETGTLKAGDITNLLPTTLSTTTTEDPSPVVEEEALPDFKVESSDIVVSNIAPKSGDVINVSFTVWNVGNNEGNVTIRMYYDGYERIDTSAIIEANKNVTLSTSLEMWESGNRTIRVELNPFPHFFDSHTSEKKLTNNKANKTLNVKSAKVLDISAYYTDKIDYKQNEKVTIVAHVFNRYDDTPTHADWVTAYINGSGLNFTVNLTQTTKITWEGKEHDLTNVSNLYIGYFTAPTKEGIYEIEITAVRSGYVSDFAHLGFEVLPPT